MEVKMYLVKDLWRLFSVPWFVHVCVLWTMTSMRLFLSFFWSKWCVCSTLWWNNTKTLTNRTTNRTTNQTKNVNYYNLACVAARMSWQPQMKETELPRADGCKNKTDGSRDCEQNLQLSGKIVNVVANTSTCNRVNGFISILVCLSVIVFWFYLDLSCQFWVFDVKPMTSNVLLWRLS